MWNVNSTARWIWQKYAMRHCIAVGCSSDSKKDKDLLFLQLPKVKCTLKRWLNYIRRERLNVDPTVDNWHHVLCSIAFYGWMPILPIQTFEKHLPSLFVNYNFKQSIRRKKKRNTHIRVEQLISSVTLTALQTNHFRKEQSLLNFTRTKPS